MNDQPSDNQTTDAPKTHHLKTWPYYWDAVETGAKTFEIRKNDRGYHVGDILVLHRWDPETGTYTDNCRPLCKRVTFVMSRFLDSGYVAMGLADE